MSGERLQDHWSSGFENETRNSVKVCMFRFINIPSTNQSRDHLDTPHAAHAGHRRVSSCYDSAENLWQKCVISEENCFLKTKSFLFSLLCIVHINLAYQNVIPLPSGKYDWFYVSKIQFYVKYIVHGPSPKF